MRLLLFLPADPEVRLAQIEADFTTRGIIIQKSHFDDAISSFSPELGTKIRNIFLKPAARNPYSDVSRKMQRMWHKVGGWGVT